MENPDEKHLNPEFSRAFVIASLPREPKAVRADATSEECAALARRFGLVSLSDFSIEAEITRWRGGIRVVGRVSGDAVQRSVTTLDPVLQAIDERFDRGFLPDASVIGDVKPGAEIEIGDDPDLGDIPDPLGDHIDIGELAAETLGLALNPYPRADNESPADLVAGPPGEAAMTDQAAKPFASLAAYRNKLKSHKDDA